MILGCILEGVDDVAPYPLETIVDHYDKITVTEPQLFIDSCIKQEGLIGAGLAKELVRVLITQNGIENTCKNLAAVCGLYALATHIHKYHAPVLMATLSLAVQKIDCVPGVIHPKLLPTYLEMLACNEVLQARHLEVITPEMCEMWNDKNLASRRKMNISYIHSFLATPKGWEIGSKLPTLHCIARMGFGKMAFGWRGRSMGYAPEYIRILLAENPDLQPLPSQSFSLGRREPSSDSWRCVGRFLFPTQEAAEQASMLLWKAYLAFGNGYINNSSFRVVCLKSQLVAYSNNDKLDIPSNSPIASVVEALEVSI